MRKRLVATAGAIVIAGGLAVAGSSAEAADCSPGPTAPNTGCTTTVTAVVGGTGLTGLRTLGAVAPVALAGTSTLTGALSVPVVEASATGAAWSVTAQAGDLTDASNDKITASHLSVADTTLPAGVGCLSLSLNPCTITGGGATARALDSAKTLFSVAGESASTLYTGTYDYTGLLSLSVPNGTPAGVYTGQLTVTLVQ